ncbi:MAG: 1,4-alpha-glucan branching protein GlgB [Oscillospiraceae bacterium]|nr:1,4-alpha-glucan branching protein GlgB [Oscillospiraceae bacterium]
MPIRKKTDAGKNASGRKKTTDKAVKSVSGSADKHEAAGVPGRIVQADYPGLDIEKHLYFFHAGSDCRAYEFLGAHPAERDGVKGTAFRVWAPDAQVVSVIGDFNQWKHGANALEKISVGVWACFVPGLAEYDAYKYAVIGKDGNTREKSDPYAFHAELRPKTASKIYEISGYRWNDQDWQKNLSKNESPFDKPINIYEMHLASWRRRDGGGILSYAEIAGLLIPYLKEMGYTHVEIMPVMEHPLDASWGYQITGYFAASSRFGTPKELMALIDGCHQAGIGVILDWVPAHFPKDGHGLIDFDGGACYEYSDPERREHPDWGTRIFDYGRNETISFLMSSAVFWLDLFHADGLRVDAVASMLYLDYGKNNGGPRNIYGGNENLEAIEFLKKTNEQVFAAFPHTLMIAEESTDWPMVTKPGYSGGLGFNFKWNMGWMNDTLSYIKHDPINRQYHHNQMTFSMMYAFSENYILPLSHDEVVHGKCSLIEKMPGYYVDKFAGLRSYLAYQIAHPGKKMTFMGAEFAQFIEWNFTQSLDWHLLEYEMHKKFQDYVRELNHFYLRCPAFWQRDDSWEGFQWIDAGDYHRNILSFRRIDNKGNEIVCLFNFSPIDHNGFRLGVPASGKYREIFSSNQDSFGGWGATNGGVIKTEKTPCNDLGWSVSLNLPPFCALFLEKTE